MESDVIFDSRLLGKKMMRAATLFSIACLFIFASLVPAVAQDTPPDLDFEFKVTKAIEKGCAWLKGRSVAKNAHHFRNGNALILLTYAHAGVDQNDAHFQKLLKEALEDELLATYGVCLIAMSLEEIDRVKYQWRIFQCAQYLVDNISLKGTIRYGEKTELPPPPENNDVATNLGGKDTGTGRVFGESSPKPASGHSTGKPKVTNRIPVKKNRPGQGDHDHSNMQYLALGLRACHDAGIILPKELILAFQKHLKDAQLKASGPVEPLFLDTTELQRAGGKGTRATLKAGVAPKAWSYTSPATKGSAKHKEARGSMTAGSIGALCICSYLLKQDWKQDKEILEGMQWLNKNFMVDDNPGYPGHWHYYYLYGLERAGMLYGTKMIGDHDWYRTGAEYLLAQQSESGQWKSAIETCFAILFLKKATRALVATGSGRH